MQWIERGDLSLDDAFMIATEVVFAELHTPKADDVRRRILMAMRVPGETTNLEDEIGRLNNKYTADMSVPGAFFLPKSLYVKQKREVTRGGEVNLHGKGDKKNDKSSNPWKVAGGGRVREQGRAEGARRHRGGGTPYYPQLKATQYISDWVIDAFVKAITVIATRPDQIHALYPDAVRKIMDRDGQRELTKVFRKDGVTLLAPLLVHKNHWVLLVISRETIRVFDSLRSHTGTAATDFATVMIKNVPSLMRAKVVDEDKWPQQPSGSNDCALYVIRAVLHICFRTAPRGVEKLFSRNDVDSLLPHISGASTASETNKFTEQLYAEANFNPFVARVAEYIHADSDAPAALKSQTGADQSEHREDTNKKLTASLAPEKLTAQAMQARVEKQKPRPCPHPGCVQTVTPPHGRECDTCGGRFCTRHKAVKKGQPWRCATCTEKRQNLVKCGHRNCTINGGKVDFAVAVFCTVCKKPVHKRHVTHCRMHEYKCAHCRAGFDAKAGDFKTAQIVLKPPEERQQPAPQPPPSIEKQNIKVLERQNINVLEKQNINVAPSIGMDSTAASAQDFRIGQGSPLLALTAGQLIAVLARSLVGSVAEAEQHRLSEKGLSSGARASHIRLLKAVCRAPQECHPWPVARMVLEVLERERCETPWGWPSMESNSTQMAGAMLRLPIYTKSAIPSLRLTDDREWTDATRHIRKLARLGMRTTLPSIKRDEMKRLVEGATNPAFKLFIILMWACAGRPGDVIQLRKAGVTLGSTSSPPRIGERTQMSVFFERGKVIGKIDPYTIHTAIPEAWAVWMKDYLNTVKTEFLFQIPDPKDRQRFQAHALVYVRTVVPECDLRAFRRGSAQDMAERKVPLATILQFTRHTDLPMLRRYLRFGRTLSEESTRAIDAASKLWPENC